MSKEQTTIQDWLNAMSKTVELRNIHAHMGLISKTVRVYGIPGVAELTYIDWRKRRQHEFDKKLLQDLSYNFIQMKNITPKRLHFAATETMSATSGTIIEINKEIILEKEYDGVWRLVEENINSFQKI